MQVTILGTAAAEAIPNPYCSCSVCLFARAHGGRDCRARSAALVNNDLLIDLGPDLISSVNNQRIYLGDLSTLLVTHKHADHWLPQNLMWRRSMFSPTLKQKLHIYAPNDVLSELQPALEDQLKILWTSVSGGDRWSVGNYDISAIPATHGDGLLQALIYVIDDGKSRMFYATDTAPLSSEAWEILSTLGVMDLILLDATMGPADGGKAHHGINQFISTRQLMIDYGILDPAKTKLIAHHFSHNAGLSHEDLLRIFSPYNVKVAYDGWVINI